MEKVQNLKSSNQLYAYITSVSDLENFRHLIFVAQSVHVEEE
jgi:hypothetical protein